MSLFVNGFGIAMKKAAIIACSFTTGVTAFAMSDDDSYLKVLGNAATGTSIESLANKNDDNSEVSSIQNAKVTNSKGAGTLNTGLIDRIPDVSKGKKGYIKEALSMCLAASNGEYTNNKMHYPITAILGMWSNEVGTDSDTVPWYYFEKSKWEKGNKNRTILGYTSKSKGTRSIDDSGTAVGAFQYTDRGSASMSAKAKVNPSCGNSRGATPGDARFWPDCYNHAESLYTELASLVNLKKLSSNGKAMFAAAANNRGASGAVRQACGGIYNEDKINTGKGNQSQHDLDETFGAITKMFDDWWDSNGTKIGKKVLNYTGDASKARAAALAIAVKSGGWYVSPALYSYYAGSMKSLYVNAWKEMWPKDKSNPITELKKARCDSIAKSIERETGVTVSASDCEKVYGSQAKGSQSFNAATGYYLWHVSKERATGKTYKNSYSKGKPFLISRYESIGFGYLFSNYPAVGNYVYAAMLKAAGINSVDPTDPDTYMNNTSTSFTAAGISKNFTKKAKKVLISYKAIDWDNLSEKRITLLKEAIGIISSGKYRYVFGGSHTEDGVTKENKYCVNHAYDCSSFVRATVSLATKYYPCQNSSYYSDNSSLFKVVSRGDAKPGDVAWHPGHVMIFAGWLDKDKTRLQALEAANAKLGILCNNRSISSAQVFVKHKNIDK